LRRYKGNATTNGVVGPLVYRARGNYTLNGPWSEFAGIFLPMDINEDGIVDGRDLAQLLQARSRCRCGRGEPRSRCRCGQECPQGGLRGSDLREPTLPKLRRD
jgi:hypothetical protein